MSGIAARNCGGNCSPWTEESHERAFWRRGRFNKLDLRLIVICVCTTLLGIGRDFMRIEASQSDLMRGRLRRLDLQSRGRLR
jgi:hypothetical protein